jgi:hypothetical protein
MKALKRYKFIPDPAAFIWTYPYLTRFPDSRFYGQLPRTLIDWNGSMSALACCHQPMIMARHLQHRDAAH